MGSRTKLPEKANALPRKLCPIFRLQGKISSSNDGQLGTASPTRPVRDWSDPKVCAHYLLTGQYLAAEPPQPTEAVEEWDESKHPSGGNPQNRGQFSTAAGASGSAVTSNAGTNRTPQGAPGFAAALRYAPPAGSKSPLQLAQNPSPNKEEVDKLLKELGGGKKEEAAPTPGDLLGEHTWKSAKGKHTFKGKFGGVSEDGKTVTLISADGKETPVAIDKLNQEDQALIRGLQVMPDNVRFDTTALRGATKQEVQAWKERVIRSFAQLSELPEGRELLKRLKTMAAPQRAKIGGKWVRVEPDVTTPLTIAARKGGDNHIKFDPLDDRRKTAEVTIYYDPADFAGDANKERPPFIGLGKELSTAERVFKRSAAKAGNNPIINPEERPSAIFENKLRNEYNEALKDPSRKDDLRARYAEWGDTALPQRQVPDPM